MNLPTKLFHYSADPFESIRQDFHDLHRTEIPTFMKPHGFWFSVEDYEDDINWKNWCEDVGFRLETLKYRYFTKIKDSSKIIFLKTPEELNEFSIKYAGNDPYDFGRFVRDPNRPPYVYIIKWDEIMDEYDGIIIAPYQWSCRLMNPTTNWYYGWDCSSGCVWNMDAIESFTLDSIRSDLVVESEKDSQSEELVHEVSSVHPVCRG